MPTSFPHPLPGLATRVLPTLLAAAIGLAIGASAAVADDWPEYRGKGRRGVWTETGIVATLPAEGLKVRWRAPVNPGWSSPVVSDGRVFLTDFTRADLSTDVVERAICLDEETGRILWTRSWEADYRIVGATWEGPRVTPTVDGDLAYFIGATGLLFALDVESGAVRWTRDLLNDYGAAPPMWGFSSAPLVDGPRLVTVVGGENDARVVAFDKVTGEEIWRALPSDADIGVPLPIIIEAAGRPQLIIWFPEKVVSLDPTTGEQYWEQPTRTDFNMNITPPVHSGSRLLVSSFYNGSMMFELDDDRPDATLVWRGGSNNEISSDGLHSVLTTPVILGDHIFGVGSFGQFRALNATTGERLWETQALTGERARWASAFIVAHEDRFFINNDRGDLIIAQFSPAGYEEVGRTPLITPTSNSSNRRRLGGVSWVAAAYANRHVLVRNDEEVLSASLAAADYPDLPASSAPVRAALTRPAAPVAADTGLPPLHMQFAASGTAAGDSTTFEYGEFYLLSGRGINTPVLVTDYGIVAVDPARSASFEELRAAVNRITVAPITTIVNTRPYAADPERLAGYPELTEVVAQVNAAAALRSMGVFAGERARFAPTRTYASELSLFDGDSRVDLYHFGPGATGGDSVVIVPRFNMAYLGDLFPSRGVPLIDTGLGGSATALPDTLDAVVAALERAGVTYVLPGRAAPPTQQLILAWLTVDDVREYAAFCRYLLETVRDQLRGGLGVDDVVAGLALPERYNGYELQHARPYVEAVLAELR